MKSLTRKRQVKTCLKKYPAILCGLIFLLTGNLSTWAYESKNQPDSVFLDTTEDLVTDQQPKTVTGIVKDMSGEPLPGASIVEKGNTSNGVIADVDGRFTLTVPGNATLVVAYMAMPHEKSNYEKEEKPNSTSCCAKTPNS